MTLFRCEIACPTFYNNKAIFHFFLLFAASLLISSEILAQSPYQLSGTREGILFGTSIGSLTFSQSKYKKMPPLTLEEISLLKREDILAIDRGSTYNRSEFARKFSDQLLMTSIAPPLLMLVDRRSRLDFDKVGLFTIQTLLVNTAITDLTKVLVKRKRPYVYNEFTDINRKLSKKARVSFFSGHTSTVTSMYFLTAKLYSDYYPNSKWKGVMWSSAILIPATTGFLRIKAGKHYFTDVLTGFLVGATVGILIPELHKI